MCRFARGVGGITYGCSAPPVVVREQSFTRSLSCTHTHHWILRPFIVFLLFNLVLYIIIMFCYLTQESIDSSFCRVDLHSTPCRFPCCIIHRPWRLVIRKYYQNPNEQPVFIWTRQNQWNVYFCRRISLSHAHTFPPLSAFALRCFVIFENVLLIHSGIRFNQTELINTSSTYV